MSERCGIQPKILRLHTKAPAVVQSKLQRARTTATLDPWCAPPSSSSQSPSGSNGSKCNDGVPEQLKATVAAFNRVSPKPRKRQEMTRSRLGQPPAASALPVMPWAGCWWDARSCMRPRFLVPYLLPFPDRARYAGFLPLCPQQGSIALATPSPARLPP